MRYGSALTRLFGSGILLVVLTACQTEAPAANETSSIAASENAPPPAVSDATSSAASDAASPAAESGPAASAVAAAAEPRAPAPRTACGLLPASEVEPIIGGAVRDSVAMAIPATQHGPPVSQCNYGTLRNPAAASLMLRGVLDGQTAQTASDSVRQALNRAGIILEDVDGIGEVAFWGANQLHVFPGNGWHLIVSPEPGVGLPQARQMAERALARFP